MDQEIRINQVPEGQKLDEKMGLMFPCTQVPSFRTVLSEQRGVRNKLLITVSGGIGDQICAEPTIRYAIEHFKGVTISVATRYPELFKHLRNRMLYLFDLKTERPDRKDFMVFECYPEPGNLSTEFLSHSTTPCMDYPALHMFRVSLPVRSKQITLDASDYETNHDIAFDDAVFIHAGRHWPSKTFPKDWWNSVIETVLDLDRTPVLIGSNNTTVGNGTVDVDASKCLDLRDKLSIMETVNLLQKARVLLTNDSSPLHMAASGDAYIGFIATCKHADYLTHWRNVGEYGWRMKNFGLGGTWDLSDFLPNKLEPTYCDQVPESVLRKWLPSPGSFAGWACSKLA